MSIPADAGPVVNTGQKKANTDWEAIERAYRAGILSVREIAAEHGVSHTAIQKRSKAYGWDRDLKAKIQAKADALVAKREVASSVAIPDAATEKALVEANANVVVEVRLSQRKDIRRSRTLVMKLLEELEAQTDNTDLLEQLEAAIAGGDGSEGMLRVFQRVTSTSGRIDSAKKLAEAMKVLVTMECEAYNIDAVTKAEGVSEVKTPELRLVLNGITSST